jgi:hypothetical protein
MRSGLAAHVAAFTLGVGLGLGLSAGDEGDVSVLGSLVSLVSFASDVFELFFALELEADPAPGTVASAVQAASAIATRAEPRRRVRVVVAMVPSPFEAAPSPRPATLQRADHRPETCGLTPSFGPAIPCTVRTNARSGSFEGPSPWPGKPLLLR